MVAIEPRVKATDPQKVFHYTDLQRTKPTREEDPYEYQCGWGNRHQSEVIPGALPIAQNNPQDRGFGLYTEGITYTYFAAPRVDNSFCYMYRARPSAAHSKFLFLHIASSYFPFGRKTDSCLFMRRRGVRICGSVISKVSVVLTGYIDGYKPIETKSHIENCFLSLNKEVETLPQQAEWSPFPLPKEDEQIDFIDGHHTLCGSGVRLIFLIYSLQNSHFGIPDKPILIFRDTGPQPQGRYRALCLHDQQIHDQQGILQYGWRLSLHTTTRKP